MPWKAYDALRVTMPQDEEIFKERKEKLRHLQKKAFQQANYYFLFQSVVFISFYSGSHTHDDVRCRYRWVPITLSSLAGVIHLCALFGFAWRYYHMMAERDQFAAGNTGGSYPIAMRIEKMLRIICIVVCILCFVAFLGVTIAGCFLITCAPT